MYCSKCGRQLASDANFCPSCGTPTESNCSNYSNSMDDFNEKSARKVVLEILTFINSKWKERKINNTINMIKNHGLYSVGFSKNYFEKHSPITNALNLSIEEYLEIINHYDNLNQMEEDQFICLFNSWIKEFHNSSAHGARYEDVKIHNSCKRCGCTQYFSGSYNTKDAFTYEKYEEMMNNPNYLCPKCEQWKKIIPDLMMYSNDYRWKKAVNDYYKLSESNSSDMQMDLNDFKHILHRNDIEVSESIIAYWNRLFDKYNGDYIIKFYSDNALEQGVSRFLGGLFRGGITF